MKKIGILFTVIIMAVLFAVSASAETEGYYTYNVYNDKAIILFVDESISGDITIPSKLGGYSVTTIDDYAFYRCTSLTSVTIPDGLTTIGYCAFDYCTSLTSVTIPDSVTVIGNYAFGSCTSLTSVTIPDGLITIGDGTFIGCTGLTSVTIPDSVTTIGDDVFWNCTSLTSVTIPDSVTTIGDKAFWNCTSLTSLTIGDSVTTIGDVAFWNCIGLINVTIPDSVMAIGDEAFKYCDSLTSITVDVDNNVYSSDSTGVLFNKNKTVLIRYPAGKTNSLYTIPDSVTTIGNSAFYSCDSLTSVTIPDSVTTIGDYAFYGCTSLTSITIPDSVTTIGRWTFGNCDNLTSVYYKGLKEQWSDIEIGTNNEDLLKADMHYHYNNHSYNAVVTEPTCTEQGYTTYVCECEDSYVADYVAANGHSYNATVTAPTCIEQGYTAYICDKCGDSYVDDFVDAKGHSHTSEITKEATHKEEGVKTFTCECGDTYTEAIAIIPHAYDKVVTAPTCTEDGYTTYTCECGDTYKGDIVNKTGHSYTSAVTKTATHLAEGVKTYTCSACSHSYTEAIAKTKEHSHVASSVVAPTCEDKGYTVYTCECGDSYKDNYTSKTSHNYSGQLCTKCGEKCSCNCHKSGFMGFIWKITLFFNKLFKTNRTCACGVGHY